MIKPTIGRIVHVYRGGVGPYAAIVTQVWNDREINVALFAHEATVGTLTGVQLVQDGDIPSGTTFAVWMPYQKGQAAKTEQLEQQLTSGLAYREPIKGEDPFGDR